MISSLARNSRSRWSACITLRRFIGSIETDVTTVTVWSYAGGKGIIRVRRTRRLRSSTNETVWFVRSIAVKKAFKSCQTLNCFTKTNQSLNWRRGTDTFPAPIWGKKALLSEASLEVEALQASENPFKLSDLISTWITTSRRESGATQTAF